MRPFGRRILLTYGGGSIKRIGLYDRVKELLKDFEIFELGGIEPKPEILYQCSGRRTHLQGTAD